MILTTNLSPEHAGDATEVPDDELRAGIPRFIKLLSLCRPRIVVALTKKVYELLSAYLESSSFGSRLATPPHYTLEN